MILGLHHVTATVDGAQDDLDFYVGHLGLRLVKKTVNFDNPQVYHFYYGNEAGSPGTLMTTFPYRGWGVRPGRHGNGQITETRFAVPEGAAGFWSTRLSERGLTPVSAETSFGEATVSVRDPSGLEIVLVEARDDRTPWIADGVGPDHAIRGIHSVAFPTSDPRASTDFLERLLGWAPAGTAGGTTRMGASGGGSGRWIDVTADPTGARGINGLGTVHHVAMSVDGDETQAALRERILSAGVPVTEVRDRQYFRSIYFREPGGVLYEIATVPPGFAIDESVAELGSGLKLPPWEEANRARIEEGLAPVKL